MPMKICREKLQDVTLNRVFKWASDLINLSYSMVNKHQLIKVEEFL